MAVPDLIFQHFDVLSNLCAFTLIIKNNTKTAVELEKYAEGFCECLEGWGINCTRLSADNYYVTSYIVISFIQIPKLKS